MRYLHKHRKWLIGLLLGAVVKSDAKCSDKGSSRRLPEQAIQLVEGLVLHTPPRSAASIHRQVTAIANEQGWKPPSYELVRQIIKKLDPVLVRMAHQGTTAYHEAFDLLYWQGAPHSNAMWQTDPGLALFGIPGLERRVVRAPQRYSRIGFHHEMGPLSKVGDVRFFGEALESSREARLSPTVVDDWRERIGACNDKAVRELDACVESRTRQDGRQKKEAVSRQDE